MPPIVRPTRPFVSRPYTPVPTMLRFHNSRATDRFVRGPRGSGKTTGIVQDVWLHMCHIEPLRGTKLRSSRWVFVANTHDRISSTAIKEWLFWFPDSVITDMSFGTQRVGKINFHRADDGTDVEAEILFTSADDLQSAGKFKSMQLTGVWMVEMSEFPDDSVYMMLRPCIGRWPSELDGGASWQGVMGDTNAMSEDHWLAKLERERPVGMEFFVQPPAMLDAFPFDPKNPQYVPNEGQDPRRWNRDGSENPEYGPAENIGNLTGSTPDNPRGGFAYYINLCRLYRREWVRVFIQNELGMLSTNTPVYAQYSDDKHAAHNLTPLQGTPLRIGFDWGLTPCCIICQLNQYGVWKCLEEVTSEHLGAKQFALQRLAPVLLQRYNGIPIIASADPAGMSGDQSDSESNCFKVLSAIGITVTAAPSQKVVPRYEAVAEYLDQPGRFLLDVERCPTLHKGFKGGYYLDSKGVPCKDECSHIHNALEYIMLHTSVHPTDQPQTWNGEAFFGAQAFKAMGFGGPGSKKLDTGGNPTDESPTAIPRDFRDVQAGGSGMTEEVIGHWC